MENDIGLISVIMTAHNAQNTVRQAIQSVLTQSYENWELIVVNDASEDSTGAIIDELSAQDDRITIINNKQNRGVFYSRKRAAEESKGEWIAILDSDDEWTFDKLEVQVALQIKQNADFVFSGYEIMNPNGELIGFRIRVPQTVTYNTLLHHNIILNSSVLIRKNLYIAYYPIQGPFHEDYVHWLNILKDGITAYGIDQSLLSYRVSPKSRSGNKFRCAVMTFNGYIHSGVSLPKAVACEFIYTIHGIVKYCRIGAAVKRSKKT